jgi:phosphatidylglycerophosphatase C
MPSRQSSPQTRPVVAFDFDGTLTVRDTYTAFLVWRTSWLRAVDAGVRLLPHIARYAFVRDRSRLKAASAQAFLRGSTAEDLAQSAQRFASARFDSLLRPDALACWEHWGRQGALRLIVTASPEILVAPFANRLGADDLLGTRLELDADGRVTGRLDGANCRAREKVVRLLQAYGPDLRLTAAYGDSSGDVEMLALADQPHYRVFHERP